MIAYNHFQNDQIRSYLRASSFCNLGLQEGQGHDAFFPLGFVCWVEGMNDPKIKYSLRFIRCVYTKINHSKFDKLEFDL